MCLLDLRSSLESCIFILASLLNSVFFSLTVRAPRGDTDAEVQCVYSKRLSREYTTAKKEIVNFPLRSWRLCGSIFQHGRLHADSLKRSACGRRTFAPTMISALFNSACRSAAVRKTL